MTYALNDTIAALATVPGTSALALIRISGDKALAIVQHLLFSTSDSTPVPVELKSWTARHGYLVNPRDRSLLDEVLVTSFPGPRSYTGEDLIEITCHGNPLIIDQIMDCLLHAGARFAEPGEFTLRAFMNGRLDLTQAEAINDLIAAQSTVDLQQSMNQLTGKLTGEISLLRDELKTFYSTLVLVLDFPEEDVPALDSKAAMSSVGRIRNRLEQLIDSARTAFLIKEGIRTPIIGVPNIGKSSLMNMLLQHDRCIVSPIAGTTRDTIDAKFQAGGLLFTIIDTAGICSSEDEIEREGIKRTELCIAESDLLIILLTPEQDLLPEEREILTLTKDKPRILAYNKIDTVDSRLLPAMIDREQISQLSLLTGTGTDVFMSTLIEQGRNLTGITTRSVQDQSAAVITNNRQKQVCQRALEALIQVEQALIQGITPDVISCEVEAALHAFDDLLGKTTPDEILNSIFANFCIGK